MSGASDLLPRVKAEILRTGYPTQVRLADSLQRESWGIVHSPAYLDDVEGISREYDLRAYRQWTVAGTSPPFLIGVYLIIECKKSDKPWVFFTTEETHDRGRLGELIRGSVADKNVFTTRNSPAAYLTDDDLRSFHHYFRVPRLAHSYFEPFKGKDPREAAPTIFGALLSCTKPTLFLHKDRPMERWLRIHYPVVVFDGQLLDARIREDGDIELVRVPSLIVEFSYMAPNPSPRTQSWENEERFYIDVVSSRGVPDFAKALESDHEAMANLLAAKFADKTGSA